MISIIIPLFNKEKLIAKTLQSVFDQTFADYEIIMVNDGSTDGSESVVRSFKDSRIRLINQPNAGVSAARNRGIAEAKGEYVAFLDADDTWLPDYLEKQVKLARKYPQCDVVARSYLYCRKGKIVSPRITHIELEGKNGILSNYFEVACHSDPPLWTCSIMLKRKAVNEVKGFPVGVKSGEDLLTWARLAARNGIAYSLEPLAIYNQGFSNPRPPERTDVVGMELEKLYKNNPNIKSLNKYVAFWYKMRMCRCIAHSMWGKAFSALCLSLKYNPLQWKIYLSMMKYLIKK